MADVFAALNALALSANQTTVQMAQMAAAMEQHAAFAQRPRAQPLPRLESKSFARLNIESGSKLHKISTLCAWEAAIRYNVDSFDGMREDLPLVRLISGTLGSLKGTVRTTSQGMNIDQYAENNPANAGQNKQQLFETFFSDLSNVLLGASVPEKAYSLFRARKQGKDETIHPYHALGKEKPPRLTEIRGDSKAKAKIGAKAKTEEARPEGEVEAKGDKAIRATEVALQPKEEASNVIRATKKDTLLENALQE